MNIVKYKKIGIGKYKVVFENTELILYEDVILKYDLIRKNNITLNELEKIIEDNKYYEAYNIALKYISIKMRSEKEIRKYFENKNYDNEVTDKAILKLEEDNLLNSKQYIEAYINDSINLKNIGAFKIKEELLKLGFNEEEIDEHLKLVLEEVWIEKIKRYIEKAVNKNKSFSNNVLKQKILNDLYIKGYDKEMICSLLENISLNDKINLKREYDRAYRKYNLKYKEKELNNKIISYLQRKGYDYISIQEQIKKETF